MCLQGGYREGRACGNWRRRLARNAGSGEKRFLVEWDRKSGEVSYDFLAYYRPQKIFAHLRQRQPCWQPSGCGRIERAIMKELVELHEVGRVKDVHPRLDIGLLHDCPMQAQAGLAAMHARSLIRPGTPPGPRVRATAEQSSD